MNKSYCIALADAKLADFAPDAVVSPKGMHVSFTASPDDVLAMREAGITVIFETPSETAFDAYKSLMGDVWGKEEHRKGKTAKKGGDGE